MSWIEPVYDRTIEDVETAIEKIKLMKKTGVSCGALKGCLSINDLNRIEGNIEYLDDCLYNIGFPTVCNTKQWSRTSEVLLEDSDRIIRNIKNLYKVVGVDNPILPQYMRTYIDINSIEKHCAIIKERIDNIVAPETGTFYTGEEMPIIKRGNNE